MEVPAMRYAILLYDENTANPSPPSDPVAFGQVMEEWNRYTEMLKDRGHYAGGEALQPVTTATTVRIKNGQTLTTDGPFAETKEALGGFYLVDANDLDEAMQLAAACPGAKYGTVEVRPIIDFSAPDVVDQFS
jgi:hypothetical protein